MPPIIICVAITANIKPMIRVITFTTPSPRIFRSFCPEINIRNVIRQSRANEKIIIARCAGVDASPTKFIAVEMVPGPARIGIASGDMAMSVLLFS